MKKFYRFGMLFLLLVIWTLPSGAGSEEKVQGENLHHATQTTSTEAAATADTEHKSEHGHGAVTTLLLELMLVLLVAKIGGDIAVRLKQPEVLGELVVGVILGNLVLFTEIQWFEFLARDEVLTILSELGVILLLFEVGLETSVQEMMKVGLSAFLAAVLGVVFPFGLGFLVAQYFSPDAHYLVHVFVGATLTATSVGITARVLKDIGKVGTKEAKIILGAAVIDDVLGLLVLAVVVGIIKAENAGDSLDIGAMLKIVFSALGFLGIAISVGNYFSPLWFKAATLLRSRGLLLAMSLAFCFGMAYLAALVDLAPIVGAFTAGLILMPVHYKDLSVRNNDATIEELIAPITQLLLPIFFVVMGAKVDLRVFADVSVLGFALALTIVAILGKQACGLGVIGKGADRTAIGLGMIPRGEVGLIFIGIGATLFIAGAPVVDARTYGAVVIMVIVTTMVTPPLVVWRFHQMAKKAAK